MNQEQAPLSTIRHSAAHILAQAVLELYPHAKLGIGPAIDDGFYYDFDIETTLSDEDLKNIEKHMKRIIKEKQPFTQYNLSKKEAIKQLKEKNQTYKIDLIEDLNLDEYSFYKNGPFVDLCKGPHIQKTNEIKAIKLLKVSGAYWRGSEKNKMLQRIYGTAFYSKEDLQNHLTQLEEAKKRDHRILGKQLDLFSTNDDIGPGLILWHPKGSIVRHLIETEWKNQHFEKEYQLLHTPHIGKAHLWETSGHLDCYKENMFSPIDIDEHQYYAKPMNCPFHTMVYKAKQHSYRQLPIRYAELGTVYRYERSGVLHGLFRVRGFTQDDAHIICTPQQVDQEIENVLSFCMELLNKFGFSDVKIFISTRPKEKSVGDNSSWKMAQSSLEKAVKKMDLNYEVDEGGGAFYGPKIDIKIKDSIGREWQCSTIQFDFNLPERFDMTFINDKGEKERPFMIHRALLGSIERFFGILIEHYEGKFPVWLAPVQVKILTIHESGNTYAKSIATTLKQHKVRTELDLSNEKINYKIRLAITEKAPHIMIIGKQEIEDKTVSIRNRETGETTVYTVDTFLNLIEL